MSAFVSGGNTIPSVPSSAVIPSVYLSVFSKRHTYNFQISSSLGGSFYVLESTAQRERQRVSITVIQ